MDDSIMKLAIFDFCETLVNFQTADAFVLYAIKENKIPLTIQEKFRRVLCKTKMIKFVQLFCQEGYANKRMLLKSLKGISYETLQILGKKYYEEIVRPNLLSPVLKELKHLQDQNYRICLASAGYDIYLQHFTKEYKIEDLICTTLYYRDGSFTGQYNGNDCVGKEKAKRIEKYYYPLTISEIESIGYTDSHSDMPMLNLCRKQVVIQKKGRKRFSSMENMKIIEWS